jgi:hypothetical protein
MSDGWTNYAYQRPPRGILCQFERRPAFIEYDPVNGIPLVSGNVTQRFTGYVDDFGPGFNVAYLYWRLTGIGREELEAMPEQVRAQRERPALGSFQQMANAVMGSVYGCSEDSYRMSRCAFGETLTFAEQMRHSHVHDF